MEAGWVLVPRGNEPCARVGVSGFGNPNAENSLLFAS